MKWQSFIQALALTGSITCFTACSQQYNGAIGFGSESDAPAAANAAATPAGKSATAIRARPAEETLAAQYAAARTAPLAKPGVPQPRNLGEPQFDTPADASGSASSAGVNAQFASAEAGRATRPMSLFGQIAGSRAGRSSPLDSPDNIRRVTFATEGADFDPFVDRSGKWLVYASTQHRKTSDLYIKKVDGTAVTQLTNDQGNDVMPVFSPDGKSIAFASDRAGNWDIYVMSAAGGQPTQVTSDATDDIHPSFSPDGKNLVYCSHGAQSGQWELVVVDVANPATKRFIGYGLLPSWSPMESKIAFQRARERGTRWFSVWTIDYVNGEGVRPTEIAASSNAAVITPSWSPDGNHLVFCTVLDPAADEQTRPGKSDIWIVAADGTGRINLTHSEFNNLQPVWANDGAIYFISNRSKDSTDNVYAIRPDRALRMAEVTTDPEPTVAAPPKPERHAPVATTAVRTPSPSLKADTTALAAEVQRMSTEPLPPELANHGKEPEAAPVPAPTPTAAAPPAPTPTPGATAEVPTEPEH